MTRFYLLRHGETEWNRDGNRYCGRSDIPLAPAGLAQAAQAARALAHVTFSAAYCSPLQRSVRTAAIIAEPHGLAVGADARIAEIDFGRWEGLTSAEIMRTDPDSWSSWQRDPATTRAGGTGETGQELYDRFAAFLDEANRVHAGETVLVVGHNTLNRIYIAASLERPLRQDRKLVQAQTGINLLEIAGNGPRWIQINGHTHLEGLLDA